MTYKVTKQNTTHYPSSMAKVAKIVGCCKQTVAWHFSTKKKKEVEINGFKIERL